MDQAIVLSPSRAYEPGARELIKNALVYLGDEFCIHKQPSFADFAAVRKLTGRAPVLLSTLLTDPALESYARLLAECAKKAPGAEVVVNDIGLLRLLDRNYRGRFRITLGRLMTYFFDTKHGRLPGCSRAAEPPGRGFAGRAERGGPGTGGKAPDDWETRLNVTPVAYIRDFLERYAVERVETDSREIFKKYADNTDVKIAFHYPLRLMSMTRFCQFMGGIAPRCAAPCGQRLLRLKTRELDFAVFCKGNAYFVKNKLIKHPRLDRAVKTPFEPSPGFEPVANRYSRPDRP